MSDPNDPESIKQPDPHATESAGDKKERLEAEAKQDAAEHKDDALNEKTVKADGEGTDEDKPSEDDAA